MTTIILAKDLELVSGALIKEPILNATHRFSHLCSSCRSHIYTSATNHPATALLDSGTFDDLRALTINAHIFTKYKHHWLHIPDNIPQFEEGYDRYAAWPPTSLERLSEAVSEALNPSTE